MGNTEIKAPKYELDIAYNGPVIGRTGDNGVVLASQPAIDGRLCEVLTQSLGTVDKMIVCI